MRFRARRVGESRSHRAPPDNAETLTRRQPETTGLDCLRSIRPGAVAIALIVAESRMRRTSPRTAPMSSNPSYSSDKRVVGLRAEGAPAPSPATVDMAWDDPLLGCLTIVTALLGKPVGIETLRAGLPLEHGRMTIDLLVRTARRSGFAARASRRRSLAELSPLNLPCIAQLVSGGACVIVRLDGDALGILEPEAAGGERRVPLAEFATLFAGTVIFVRLAHVPDARIGAPSSTRRRDWFWGPLGELWPVYGHVFVAALAINLLGLAGSIYAMNVYDRVVPNNAVETLWVLTLGVLIVYLFDLLLRTARAYFVDAAGKAADVVIGSRLFEQVMAIRLETRPASTGAMASTLRDYESLREFFTSATLVTLIDLPFAVLFIVAAWMIAGPVAWIAIVAIPIALGAALALQLPMARAVERNQAEAAQKHAILVEAIEGLETLKIARAEGRTQGLWERFVAASARSSMATRVYAMLALNFTAFTTAVASALVIFLGVHEIAAGRLTMGALIAATILTGRALAPLGQLAALLVRVNQSRVALRALDRLMAAPRERAADATYLTRPALTGRLAMQDLIFAYPAAPGAPTIGGAPIALHKLNLSIEAGERVGIVGRVGSGKTTVARLIAGLYQPTSGAVLVDGTDIRQLDPAELRRQ
ncbi:MAG: ATP-binding cassette domain-containing protein, partial [Alphaproteobacteria bacterium]|nr:ATP-binding cassette domain-containing protein [Alphaproteobacteria bacterium]